MYYILSNLNNASKKSRFYYKSWALCPEMYFTFYRMCEPLNANISTTFQTSGKINHKKYFYEKVNIICKVGAIFEILWLPMILMLFCLPVISCYYLFKEKFSIHSTYLYVFLLMLFTFLILSLQGQTEIEMIVKRNRELHIIEIFQDSVGC